MELHLKATFSDELNRSAPFQKMDSICSALHNLDRGINDGNFDPFTTLVFRELKLGLNNLKGLLVCVSRLGDDADLMKSLFARVQDSIGRICVKQIPIRKEPHDSFINWLHEIVAEVHSLAKEADGALTSNHTINRSHLTVDEVISIADSILDNWPDFLFLVEYHYALIDKVDVEVIDGLELQLTFLKFFLPFAMRTGVDLHNWLPHIQAIAISASRIFIADKLYMYSDNWLEQVQAKFSAVYGMAIDPKICEAYTQALSTSTISTMDENDDAIFDVMKNFLDSLISLLWDVLCRSTFEKDLFKVLYERLRFCRTILKQQHPRSFDGNFKNQIGGLIGGAGMFICLFRQTNAELSDPGPVSVLLERFNALQAHVDNNASQTLKANELGLGDFTKSIEDIKISDGEVEKEVAAMSRHQPLKSATTQVSVFQDDELASVLDRLTRGSKQLRIVPISGMPGIGKTTFTLELYNHPSVICHFHARAWCPISQVLDKKKVWIQLLNKLADDCGSYSEMTEGDLANKVRQTLKGKRYLIFLDDVWTPQVWNSLIESFPDDSTQSRIILTSRHHDIVPHPLPDEQPHLLCLRTDNECLEILQMNLSYKEGWTAEVGMKIAKLCKGLPLTVVIVAGLLATTKQERWVQVLDELSSGILHESEQCNNALELSYKHLPDHLQQCFLYFGAFPEDYEVDVERLIHLWMAEGFVRKNELKRIEDVALEYLENLIQRSLVMVDKKEFQGHIKTCRIHDLLHEFCLVNGQKENLFHLLHTHDQLSDFNEPCNLQRLSIHSNLIHFKESRLFCPRAHSMLFFSTEWCLFDLSFIILIYKQVKVLDIDHIPLATGIPSDIELLTQLEYLSIWSNVVTVMPSSIGSLSNLETFICNIRLLDDFPLPETLWNLRKLKYLDCVGRGFILPIENLENSSILLELETIYDVVLHANGNMEKQMRKFPNIRTLKCNVLPCVEGTSKLNKIVVPDFLNQLRSLDIFGEGRLQLEFGSNENLTKVILGGFDLSRKEIAVIGKLPCLEVLELLRTRFVGGTLDMEEGEFLKLRFFRIYDSGHGGLKRWTAYEEQLPCLQKLILHYCEVLEEIPSYCLEISSTLEEIELKSCSDNVESLVRDIEELQKDCGNSIKVHIRRGYRG